MITSREGAVWGSVLSSAKMKRQRREERWGWRWKKVPGGITADRKIN